MNGWLIVNSFIDSAKFQDLYDLLLAAAAKRGVKLQLRTGGDILPLVGDSFAGESLPDFALFWNKDILLARQLEQAGVRLFNAAAGVAVCDNKACTCLALAHAGIPIPRTVIAPKTFEGVGYTHTDFVDKAIDRLGLPVVIKEVYGSFGQQVYLADTAEDARRIVRDAGHKELILQEYVATSRGRDVRINVVGQQAVASMLRYNPADFRSNISNGGQMEPYTPTEEQIAVAVAAARALQMDFAGVDVLFGSDGRPIVCEVNSNPHFRSTLECTGVNLADHILQHILGEVS